MKRNFIGFLFCISILLSSFLSQAQENFKEEFLKIQNAYKGVTSLSFSVKYLYSTVENPSQIKDSVEGRYRIMGKHTWGVLSDAEYITNGDYSLIVYPQSNIMMLDKSDENLSQFFNVDSLLKLGNEFTVSSPVKGHFQFSFQENELFKVIDLFYDPNTHFIRKIMYVMRSQEAEERKEKEEALVQILFSTYSNSPFDKAVFDTEKYFVKKGKEFLPTSAYEGYTILLASSKLLN